MKVLLRLVPFAALAFVFVAASATAQTRTAPAAAQQADTVQMERVEEGSGESAEIQARPGPAPRIATTANEVRQPSGIGGSVGEGTSGGDEDDDGSNNGTGGN